MTVQWPVVGQNGVVQIGHGPHRAIGDVIEQICPRNGDGRAVWLRYRLPGGLTGVQGVVRAAVDSIVGGNQQPTLAGASELRQSSTFGPDECNAAGLRNVRMDLRYHLGTIKNSASRKAYPPINALGWDRTTQYGFRPPIGERRSEAKLVITSNGKRS